MPTSEFSEDRPINLVATFYDDSVPGAAYTLSFPQKRNIRIDTAMVFNGSTASIVLSYSLWDDQDEAYKPLGSVTVPAGTGFTTVPPLDLLALLQPALNQALLFSYDDSMLLYVATAPSAGTTLTVWLRGGYV